ncbi:chromatin structure-remodeling complex protein SYD-like [Apium graveolens]|uniref:chromatin structure-remodeling complex protein SYD-like n=1 Tax=Apium graveolens TaxID=4045 RepID=UPI003D7930E0
MPLLNLRDSKIEYEQSYAFWPLLPFCIFVFSKSGPNCRGTRAAAEHKLGVANQSITAGFFDNNTSAKDWKEYLESLLRESKKEEATPVLHDDVVNDLIFMG